MGGCGSLICTLSNMHIKQHLLKLFAQLLFSLCLSEQRKQEHKMLLFSFKGRIKSTQSALWSVAYDLNLICEAANTIHFTASNSVVSV